MDYVINYIEHHVNRNTKLTKEELQNEILRYTETIRYGIHGYIWIHDTKYYLKSILLDKRVLILMISA